MTDPAPTIDADTLDKWNRRVRVGVTQSLARQDFLFDVAAITNPEYAGERLWRLHFTVGETPILISMRLIFPMVVAWIPFGERPIPSEKVGDLLALPHTTPTARVAVDRDGSVTVMAEIIGDAFIRETEDKFADRLVQHTFQALINTAAELISLFPDWEPVTKE